MKITAVRSILLSCKCPTIADALSICNGRQALIIQIETDSNLYGIGEAFTYGCPLNVMKHLVEDQLAPHLIGLDPTQIEHIWNLLFWRTIASGRRSIVMGAISGIDIALWDLFGKAVNMPVFRLLGSFSNKIPSYASGGFYAPQKDLSALRKEIESYMDAGYKDVKIKIGRCSDLPGTALKYMASQQYCVTYKEELQRLCLTRDIIGSGRLIADLNASWDTDTVLHAYSDFKHCGLNWLEEPIRFENSDGCRKISHEFHGISIIGYETEQGVDGFNRLISNNSIAIVQPDVGWAGGISECKKIASIARAAHKPVSLHSFGSAVHFAASLHLAGSISNIEAIESEVNDNPLKTDLLIQPFEADSHMNFYVPDKPGLGIDLNWDKMEGWLVQ